MANKTIAQLSSVAGVADADEFEVQVSGETVTKKCTRKQLTQIEETARIAQDDAIEAGAGLNTDGTYFTLVDSWYLRAADFTTGLTDRGGAKANITQSIASAVRMLDSKLYESVTQLDQTLKTAYVILSPADILALNAVPKVLIAGVSDYAHEIISIVGSLVDYPEQVTTYYEAGADKLEVRLTTGSGVMFEFPNAFIEAVAPCVYRGVTTATQLLKSGSAIELYCATAPTGGNALLQFYITYRTHYVGTL
jgi:hypothetical protein